MHCTLLELEIRRRFRPICSSTLGAAICSMSPPIVTICRLKGSRNCSWAICFEFNLTATETPGYRSGPIPTLRRYRMRRSLAPALLFLALWPTGPLAAQQTRAERTGYAETSSHADVLSFLDSLRLRGAGIVVGELGRSPEGKVIPYVLASRPLVTEPGAAHRSGKPVIWIQGNIHAGEVEGKEAAQALLRELTLGALRPLLDSVILIVVPIYNTDGNDRWAAGDVNRPGQNGPAI